MLHHTEKGDTGLYVLTHFSLYRLNIYPLIEVEAELGRRQSNCRAERNSQATDGDSSSCPKTSIPIAESFRCTLVRKSETAVTSTPKEQISLNVSGYR